MCIKYSTKAIYYNIGVAFSFLKDYNLIQKKIRSFAHQEFNKKYFMINKKKYGNDFPSITKNNSYDDVKSPKKFLYTNSYSDKDENEDDDYEDDRERDNVCTIS